MEIADTYVCAKAVGAVQTVAESCALTGVEVSELGGCVMEAAASVVALFRECLAVFSQTILLVTGESE